jgi:hypothetical protein
MQARYSEGGELDIRTIIAIFGILLFGLLYGLGKAVTEGLQQILDRLDRLIELEREP